MTMDIERLVNSFGKSYRELIDAGLILNKTKPSSSSGEPDIFIKMETEGVFLSFRREGQIFNEISLSIQKDKKEWTFPNDLPFGLKKIMSRQWVHENFGKPLRSSPPEVIMKRVFGWTELFETRGTDVSISMQINYDTADNVKSVTFLPTSELRW